LAALDVAQGVLKRDPATGYCQQLCAGSCGIHRDYGTDFLGDACYFYPRTLHRMGGELHMGGAPSCPEMLRLMLTLPAAFETRQVVMDRVPQSRRELLPEGVTAELAARITRECMAIARDETATPEAIMLRLLAFAEWLAAQDVAEWKSGAWQEHTSIEPLSKTGDAHAIYYALALTEAFATPGISQRLGGIMAMMVRMLDCRFDRDSRLMTWGARAASAPAMLRARWNMGASAVLAHSLRRWIQAQLVLTAFPFGGFAELGIAERAAVLVQRFATVKLALMSAVAEDGTAPELSQQIEIIQGIARFMDHLADAKLTMMIHRDSGWNDPARLRGLVMM
jgi:hypothetical protein